MFVLQTDNNVTDCLPLTPSPRKFDLDTSLKKISKFASLCACWQLYKMTGKVLLVVLGMNTNEWIVTRSSFWTLNNLIWIVH